MTRPPSDAVFTPEQERALRIMIAEMIGQALRGADDRMQRSIATTVGIAWGVDDRPRQEASRG